MSAIDFIVSQWSEVSTLPNINDTIAIATMQTGNFGNDMIGTMGTKKEYAIALRTMHMIALDAIVKSQEFKGGNITSESAGELSRSYSVSDVNKKRYPDLCTTSWGVKLIELINNTFVGILCGPNAG